MCHTVDFYQNIMSGKGRLSTVNLSFSTPTTHTTRKNGVHNNGVRPHGGHRGTKAHPPSPYSFNKSEEYQDQIRQDVTDWLEKNSPKYAPNYVMNKMTDKMHSTQSPLFENNFLSPSRFDDIAVEPVIYGKLEKGKYKRQERKHEYLLSTDRSCSSSQLSLNVHSRPTRTTVLRERQRCNSAPIYTPKRRRQAEKDFACHLDRNLSMQPSRLSVNPEITCGKSVYSFLVGARYNRAHCLDARSAEDFGVYMPRGNPLGCFVMKNKFGGSDDLPSPPPDSPRSQSDVEDEASIDYFSPKQKAWSTQTGQPHNQPMSAVKTRPVTSIPQIINIDDGLNGKGENVNDKKRYGNVRSFRPKSARAPLPNKTKVRNYTRPATAVSASTDARHSFNVHIQGQYLPTRRTEEATHVTERGNKPDVTIPTGVPPPTPSSSGHNLEPRFIKDGRSGDFSLQPTCRPFGHAGEQSRAKHDKEQIGEIKHLDKPVHVKHDATRVEQAPAPVAYKQEKPPPEEPERVCHETLVQTAGTVVNIVDEKEFIARFKSLEVTNDALSDTEEKRSCHVRFADQVQSEALEHNNTVVDVDTNITMTCAFQQQQQAQFEFDALELAKHPELPPDKLSQDDVAVGTQFAEQLPTEEKLSLKIQDTVDDRVEDEKSVIDKVLAEQVVDNGANKGANLVGNENNNQNDLFFLTEEELANNNGAS